MCEKPSVGAGNTYPAYLCILLLQHIDVEPPGFPEMIDQAARGKEQWFVCRQCSSAVNWQTRNGVVCLALPLVESSASSKFHWLDRSNSVDLTQK